MELAKLNSSPMHVGGAEERALRAACAVRTFDAEFVSTFHTIQASAFNHTINAVKKLTR